MQKWHIDGIELLDIFYLKPYVLAVEEEYNKEDWR